jgi:hypothetical protein
MQRAVRKMQRIVCGVKKKILRIRQRGRRHSGGPNDGLGSTNRLIADPSESASHQIFAFSSATTGNRCARDARVE